MTVEIKSESSVAGMIGKLGKASAAIAELAHDCGMQCMLHAAEHGNTNLCRDMLNTMHVASRRQALAAWFRKYSNKKLRITLDESTDTFSVKLAKGWGKTDFQIETANADPFWKTTKEVRPDKPFSLDDLLKYMRSKLQNDETFDDGTPKVSAEAQHAASKMLTLFWNDGRKEREQQEMMEKCAALGMLP